MFARSSRPASLGGLVVGLLLLAGCGGDAPPNAAEAEAPPAPAAEPATDPSESDLAPELSESVGLLVSVAELKQRIGQPGTHVLDARPKAEYDAGHVPGAVHVDVAAWKSQAQVEDGLRDAQAWGALVGGLGIEQYDNLIVYGGSPTDAARIWWTLRYLGLNHAGLLDGGWKAWTAAEGEVSTAAPMIEATLFEPEFQEQRLAELEDVKGALADGGATIVDSRSPQEFNGQGEKQGRIPGAVLVEWKELLDEEGKFRSREELKRLFVDRGIAPGQAAVTYCQSGGRASVDAFALELAGYANVRNYYCSWSEWSQAEDVPIEQGEKPESSWRQIVYRPVLQGGSVIVRIGASSTVGVWAGNKVRNRKLHSEAP